ncbi:hypothetical protein BpHYR1_013754 [Brachionus plicatilis]|uniref:Uncharacterized protein n=1 Tax=Brachionus plicatilis TaxID=10195 RepID=A0A3M7RG43_BRAPC|nr:hypothetical protein BpHYR1_013754 [Brachionus plicatilis]
MEPLSKRMRLAFVPQNFTMFCEDQENFILLRPHPSINTNSETSSQIKTPEKSKSCITPGKPFSSHNLNNRDYCLVQLEDKKYCVLSLRMVKNQKSTTISINKTYDIMLVNKMMKGVILHIGHKFDCFNRMKRLQIMAVKDENLTKHDSKSFEHELEKKDKIIKKKDDEINKLNQSIENYKRIIDKENVKRMKKFCIDILDFYEKEPVCSKVPQAKIESSVCLSENYPNERVNISTKQTMDEALKIADNSSLAFRKVITIVFPDVFLWAQNCRKSMVEKYPERIMACFDFVQKKFPDFTFNTACSIMTKISSNNRTKLKQLGYSIISKYDTMNQTSTHEIFKINSNNSKEAGRDVTNEEKIISANSDGVDASFKNKSQLK